MTNAELMVLFVPIALIAGFIRGLTGFGGPILLIPAMAFFVSPNSAALTGILVDICSNVSLLRRALQQARRSTVFLTVASAWLTIPLGGLVMLNADADIVRRLLYLAVAIAAVILLSGIRFPRPLKSAELAGGGTLAGLVMGATGLGIIIVPVLFSSPDDATTSRANLVVWVFFVSVYLAGFLLLSGRFGHAELIGTAILAPAYILGAYAGWQAFGKIDEHRFRMLVLGFLLIVSVSGLLFV